MVVELSNNSFEDFIKEGVVLIDFFADWCMPCKMMEPIFKEVSGKFKGKVKFGKVNIEDAQTLAQKFGVSTIPNFILFKDGKVVNNFIGGMSAEELSEKLEKHI